MIIMDCPLILKPASFDLGSAFSNLCRFLTTKDKLALSATSSLLRQIILKGHNWQTFEISDTDPPHWQHYLNWVQKYLKIIEPLELVFIITDEEHEKDKKLMSILMQPRKHVLSIDIRTNSAMLHLMLANCCSNANTIRFQSPSISDQLAECMFKYLANISELEINSDALEFSCKNISKYLRHPLEKLILKPYRLDYSELILMLKEEELNHLNELEIDTEMCEQEELVEIVSHLKHISRLRLYHLERYENSELPMMIASKLSSQMKQLTLTKCYYLDLTTIIDKIASPFFESLDLTQATKLNDQCILTIAHRCPNLKQLNLSWCNELTNKSISSIINNCPSLQRATFSGIKNLSDEIFEEYLPFYKLFNEKYYDQVKYDYRSECKHAKPNEIPQIQQKFKGKCSPATLFQPHQLLFSRKKTLTNLRLLDCTSCNKISDKMLKILYSFNRMAQVINYYGEDLSLCRNSFEQDFID